MAINQQSHDLPPRTAADPDVERAKAWWKEYGKAVVSGVTIGLIAVGGWNYWQHYQQARAESSARLLTELRGAIELHAEQTAARVDVGEQPGDDAERDAAIETAAESIEYLASELTGEYADSVYADFAAFLIAKFREEQGDSPGAESALQWLLDNSEDVSWRHIARLRLATLLLARNDTDGALTFLDVPQPQGFAPRYDELLGDAYLQQNNLPAARDAYERSLERLPRNSLSRAVVRLKLDNVGAPQPN